MISSILRKRLEAHIEAEQKALKSQEYQEGNRRNRRADLNDIRKGINELLAADLESESLRPGSRARRVVFRDL